MKVKDLIAKLKKLDQNALVYHMSDEVGPDWDESDTYLVVLE